MSIIYINHVEQHDFMMVLYYFFVTYYGVIMNSKLTVQLEYCSVEMGSVYNFIQFESPEHLYKF